MENPTDKGGLLLKHQLSPSLDLVWDSIATATSLDDAARRLTTQTANFRSYLHVTHATRRLLSVRANPEMPWHVNNLLAN